MIHKNLNLLAGVLWTVCSLIGLAEANYLQENYAATVIEDGHLDTAQLIRKYNYPEETHYVTTEDKYILGVHRIPRPEGRPVLLMHGLLDSSATWLLMGPWSGLGYYLYDQGYDVWMGNVRGNRYSRNHTTLNPDMDRSFWKFSWHEMGLYDLPATIDYVLEKTGYSKLGYFGHSQGTTSFWVMGSMRPEYNEKILIMHALAPVAFMKNVKNPLKDLMNNFVSLSKAQVTEFLPRNELLLRNCFRTKLTLDTCVDSLWQGMGKDTKSMNMSMLPVLYGHVPAGCNMKQWVHYMQLVYNDRFNLFDYGPKDNQKHYGKQTPPDYPLEKITARVGLYYTYNDYLSSEVDVMRLAKILPNVVEDNLLPYKKWNHVTIVWGSDARELAHKRMVEVMRKYEE